MLQHSAHKLHDKAAHCHMQRRRTAGYRHIHRSLAPSIATTACSWLATDRFAAGSPALHQEATQTRAKWHAAVQLTWTVVLSNRAPGRLLCCAVNESLRARHGPYKKKTALLLQQGITCHCGISMHKLALKADLGMQPVWCAAAGRAPCL